MRRYAAHLLPLVLLTENGNRVGRAYLDFWCLFRVWMNRNMQHWCSTAPPPSTASETQLPARTRRKRKAVVETEGVPVGDLFDRLQADRLLAIRGTIDSECVAHARTRQRTHAHAVQRVALHYAWWRMQIHVRAVLQQGRYHFRHVTRSRVHIVRATRGSVA